MNNQIDSLNFTGETVVAMSGGVDSSVAASLLVQEGRRVHGVMLHLWSESGTECDNKCCTPESEFEARQVAEKLSIPFHIINVSDLFRELVVQRFIDTYAAGRTPNPCILCNRYIRWGFLLDYLLGKGAETLATGHYAITRKTETGKTALMMGLDESKDQSYMLSMLNQKQLEHTCLPLGDYRKTEVRALARNFGLAVAEKEDSQDLCFLGKSDLRSFLHRYIPSAFSPGPIQLLNGEILGEHQGLPFYTVGQRKGLGLSHPVPLFVYGKDVEKNILYVCQNDELVFQNLYADHVNWVSGYSPTEPFDASIKIRYKSPLIEARITPVDDHSYYASLKTPIRDITPGQFGVIYQNHTVIAAGEIRDNLAAVR